MKDVVINLIDSIEGKFCETIADEIQKSIHEYKITGKFIGFCGDYNNKEFDVRGLRRGRGNVIKKLKHKMKRGIIERGSFPHFVNNCMYGGCDVLPVEVETLVVKNTFSCVRSSCSELQHSPLKEILGTKFE
jgi:hypothetical protein